MQNLVVFMEPTVDAFDTSLKAGNMIFNRFCIDEDAAFELSGVNCLKKIEMMDGKSLKRKIKGKDYKYGLRPPYFIYMG